MKIKLNQHIVVLAAVLVLIPEPSYAYVDPANGSMHTQLLLALFAALAVSVKFTYSKVRSKLK